MSASFEPVPRLLTPRLRASLADTPVVLIHGARQSGKTTLARMVGEPLGFSYLSFDDTSVLEAALRDPAGGRFAHGAVLYDGTATIQFGEGLHAVPIRKLWED